MTVRSHPTRPSAGNATTFGHQTDINAQPSNNLPDSIDGLCTIVHASTMTAKHA